MGLAVTAPAAGVSGSTIYVPDDFNPALSATRATGHYELQGSELHIWTEGATSTDKVAEYIAVNEPLAGLGRC